MGRVESYEGLVDAWPESIRPGKIEHGEAGSRSTMPLYRPQWTRSGASTNGARGRSRMPRFRGRKAPHPPGATERPVGGRTIAGVAVGTTRFWVQHSPPSLLKTTKEGELPLHVAVTCPLYYIELDVI